MTASDALPRRSPKVSRKIEQIAKKRKEPSKENTSMHHSRVRSRRKKSFIGSSNRVTEAAEEDIYIFRSRFSSENSYEFDLKDKTKIHVIDERKLREC